MTGAGLTWLQGRPDIWRWGERAALVVPGVPTGFPELDAALPGAGWPADGLSEILSDSPAAFALALPALARLSREAARWLLLVAPPWIPYAPDLLHRGVDPRRLLVIRAGETDSLWAAEQSLRSGAAGLVLLWAEPREPTLVRRLQLAAQAGRTPLLLFRGEIAARRPSPAALRLRVGPARDGTRLELEVLKCRGGPVRRLSRCSA